MKITPNGPKPFRGFVHIESEHARSRTTPRIPRDVCELPLTHLELTSDQHAKIHEKYENNQTFSQAYDPDSAQDQIQAASLLASNQLDLDARERLENKWNVRWSVAGANHSRRVLYQCACGCSSEVRKSKARHTPVDFTGCLAHGEVLYDTKTHHILYIRGFFEHDEECRGAQFQRAPSMPVHPEVYRYALTQLRAGASMATIKEANSKMYLAKAYPSMQLSGSATSRYRHLLQKSDFRTLYRQLNHLEGIKLAQKDHVNLDEWLDPTSSQYNKTLHDAIFHYSARTSKDERLEVCIATPEMKEASWKYAHKSQIILDGTFGICNKKMLLFIVMGVDESNRGVPLAFFLFSAPSDNKRTCAGYDTDVLDRMLDRWKTSMGTRNGETFDVWVAITDTDLMERGALLRVFPTIWLLICQFHLRQSWKNHRNTHLKGGTDTHLDLKGRLKRLEDALVETELHSTALTLLHQERETLGALQASEIEAAGSNDTLVAIDSALQHVAYLEEYWGRESLWQSWSKFGRLAAAALVKRSVNEVLPTTNHLESFNGVLKRTHLARWQKGGRRLRLDVLVNVLVLKILPAVFMRHKLEDMESARRKALISELPGGANLLRTSPARLTPSGPLAYIISDDQRDRAAAALVSNNQIGAPSVDDTGRIFTFSCLSSLAIAQETTPTTYTVVLNVDGTGSCTCKDFLMRGGACKHMRAALVRAILLQASGTPIPTLCLPSSLEAAYTLRGKQLTEALDDISLPLAALQLSDTIQATTEAVEDLLEAGGLSDNESVTDKTPHTSTDHSEPRADVSVAARAPIANTVDSHQGLMDQTLARTLYELEHTAPKLKQLGIWLKQTSLQSGDVERLERIQVVKSDLDILVGQLDRLVLDAQQPDPTPIDGPPNGPSCPRTPPPLRTASKRRRATEIIGPSPEKRAAKRHDSHAPH